MVFWERAVVLEHAIDQNPRSSTRAISTSIVHVEREMPERTARPIAYASGIPAARFIAARITDRATCGDASATALAVAQNFVDVEYGSDDLAGLAMRIRVRLPTRARRAQPASKSPMVPIGSVVGKNGVLLLLTQFLLYVRDFERVDERIDVSTEHFGKPRGASGLMRWSVTRFCG